MRKKYGVTDNDNRKVLKITICVTVENETESAEQIILTRRACVRVCVRAFALIIHMSAHGSVCVFILHISHMFHLFFF